MSANDNQWSLATFVFMLKNILKIFILLQLSNPLIGNCDSYKAANEKFDRKPGATTIYKTTSGSFDYSFDVKYISEDDVGTGIKINLSSTGQPFFYYSNVGTPEPCNKDIGVVHKFDLLTKSGRKVEYVMFCSGGNELNRERIIYIFNKSDLVGKINTGRLGGEKIYVANNKILKIEWEQEVSQKSGGYIHKPMISEFYGPYEDFGFLTKPLKIYINK